MWASEVRDEEAVPVDRHAALEARGDAPRQPALVLPEEVPSGCVEGLHPVAVAVHEEDAVAHDGVDSFGPRGSDHDQATRRSVTFSLSIWSSGL